MKALEEQRRLAFAKVPALIREALHRFRRLTGFAAVSALRLPLGNAGRCDLPLPPVHPRCAVLLRKTTRPPPCEGEWRKHLRFGLKTLGCKRHSCPLGLRCACVPIVLGDEFLGFAKLVAGPEVSPERFASAADQLELLVAAPCQERYVALLQDEIRALQNSLGRLERAKKPGPADVRPGQKSRKGGRRTASAVAPIGLMSQVLDYLHRHFTNRDLSLKQVAREVGKNEKYLAHLFSVQVGERMHAYIIGLRVQRACELLLATDRKVVEIAREAGFPHPLQFRHAFRRTMGVTASEYRQIFVPEASTPAEAQSAA